MKTRTAIFLLAIIAAITVSSVVAVTTYQTHYSIPQTAKPPVAVSATITINGQAWANGTSIDWGQLQLGANVIPITITNTGSVAINTVTLTNTGLPQSWTETYAQTSVSGSTIYGTITLTADASVTTTQTWTSTLTLGSS